MTPSLSFDGAQSGVALWRRIADALRLDIASGQLAAGARMPGELALAERFGVNRHTVRSALQALQREGAVRTEHGRGTFVTQSRRLTYAIGRRTRFSQSLAGQGLLEGRLLDAHEEPADAVTAEALALAPGAMVIRLEALSLADDKPISRSTGWFPAVRFPNLAAVFAASGSITTALRHYGVDDYLRARTRISARHADADETTRLSLTPGAVVLVSDSVDTLLDGTPIQRGMARFAADRVDLVVGGAEG